MTWNIIRFALGENRIIGTIEAKNGKQALKEFKRFCMFYRATLNVSFPIKLGIQKVK